MKPSNEPASSLAVYTWDTPGDSMRERIMTPPKWGKRDISPPVRAIEHGSAGSIGSTLWTLTAVCGVVGQTCSHQARKHLYGLHCQTF